MKTLLAALGAVFLGGLAFANGQTATNSMATNIVSDPIDQLVTRLSSDHMWQNGASAILGLPETASPEQVVKKVFEMTGFDRGNIKSYTVLKIREVQIQGGKFSAALVQTDIGEKIVLFTKGGGWSRVYEAKPSA